MSYWDPILKQANSPQNGDVAVQPSSPAVSAPKTPPASNPGFWGGIIAKNESLQPTVSPYWKPIVPKESPQASAPVKSSLPTDPKALTDLYTSKRSTFDENLAAFTKQKNEYEKELAKYQNADNVPQAVQDRLALTVNDLRNHAASLVQTEQELNDMVEPIKVATAPKSSVAKGPLPSLTGAEITKPSPNTKSVPSPIFGETNKIALIPTPEPGILNVPDFLKKPLSMVMKPPVAAANAIAETLNDSVQKVTSFLDSIDPRQPYTGPQVLKKMVDAGIGAFNVTALPFTASLKAGEETPIVAPIAKAINWAFGEIGTISQSGWEKAKPAIDMLPVSPEAKTTIKDIGDELVPLAAQIVTALAAHVTAKEAKQQLGDIQKNITKKNANGVALNGLERKVQTFNDLKTRFKDQIAKSIETLTGPKAEPIATPKEIFDIKEPAFKKKEVPTTEAEKALESAKTPQEVIDVAHNESQVVPISKLNLSEDSIAAAKDVQSGQGSVSKLPVLVERKVDGTYDVIEGNHRVAEASKAGKTDVLAITDAKLYRQLAAKEESFYSKVSAHDRSGTGVREYVRYNKPKAPAGLDVTRELAENPSFKRRDEPAANQYRKGGDLIDHRLVDDIAFHDKIINDITTLPKAEAREVTVANIDDIMRNTGKDGIEQFRAVVDTFGKTDARKIVREGVMTDTMRPGDINAAFDRKLKSVDASRNPGSNPSFKEAAGEADLVPNTEGLKTINEYKKRLNLKFDAKLLDTILTAEGDQAYGVTHDNTIALAKDHTKYTPDHEISHLIIRNIENIPLFKGITAEALFADARKKWGESLSKVELDEKIAEGYEQYKKERDAGKEITFTGKLKEFFQKLYDGIKDIFSLGNKNMSKLDEYYKRLAEGKNKTPVEAKSKGAFPAGNKVVVGGRYSKIPNRVLSPAERSVLEKESADIKGKIKSASPAARTIMVERLNDITKQLRRSEFIGQKVEERSTAEKQTINAFNDSTGQKPVGKIGDKEVVIGSYGENAISRKTTAGQPDRLPLSELSKTLEHVEAEYKAGNSGFRKDNIVAVAKMPNGETRAIFTRKNPAGETEVINFFKVGRNADKFVRNLESYGTPTRTRTGIDSLERSNSNPLKYEGKDSVPSLFSDVNKSGDNMGIDVLFTPDKEQRLLTEKGIRELKKETAKASMVKKLEIKLPQALQDRATELTLRKEALDENPMKGLVKYMARTGEFKGRLNEVTGKLDGGKFSRTGDRFISEVTGLNDSEMARDKFEKYIEQRRKFENDVAEFQADKQAFLRDARGKRDAVIEDQKIGRSHEKMDREREQQAADEKAKKAKIERTQAKEQETQTRLKNEMAEQSRYQRIVEEAHIKESQKETLLSKLKSIFSPIEQTDAMTKKIYTDWEIAKVKAKEAGNTEYEKYKHYLDNDFPDIIEYEAGKKTPWIFEKFEDLYDEAKKAGVDINYKEDYIPHVYREKREQVQAAIAKYLKDQNVSKEAINLFNETGEISDKIKVSLKTNPFFSKVRTFPDYKTAMKYGLTPRFHSVAEHIAFYKEELGKIVANRKLIDDLIKEGKVLDAYDAPESWVEIKLPGRLRRTYYAEKNLAEALNGQFRDEENLTFVQTLGKGVANASKLMQEIKLSAGLPGTNVNFFSIGQAIKMLTVGVGEAAKLNMTGAATSLKAASAFIRANFNGRSIEWLKGNKKYIDLMADNNMPLMRRIDDYAESYKRWGNLLTAANGRDAMKSIKEWGRGIGEAKGFKEKTKATAAIMDSRALGIGKDLFDKAFNEKTFNSMMPQMQIQVFKDIYEGSKAKGMSEKDASKFAADTVKAEFGVINELGRTQNVKDVLGAIFFAPKFRESIVNVFANAGKSLTTEIGNPAYGRSRSLVIGGIISYIAYNYLNRQLNNGDNIWDNESGHEFDLKVPLPNGKIIYTPFMPSVLSFVRNMGSGVLAFAKGDNKTGVQKAGSLFSMPIQTASEIVSNKDYFGRPIYDTIDTPTEKATKAIEHMGLAVSHPYFSELLKYFQGKQDIYQTISMMTELPLKFSTQEKAAISRAYEEKQAKTELNARERKDIGGVVDTYDEVQKLKADGKMDEAGAIVNDLSDEEYQQYQIIMKYEQIQALKKAKDTAAAKALGDTLTDEEYLQYNAIKQLRANDKRAETIQKKAAAKTPPKYEPGEQTTPQSVLESVATYAHAIGVDPLTAFNRIFTGQKIRRVDNGAIIVERMSLLESTKVKKDQGGNNPTMKLDHTVPLELGGSNDLSNLKLVPTETWESYTPVEDKLGRLLRAGKISKEEAIRLITSFKSGQVPADDIMKL